MSNTSIKLVVGLGNPGPTYERTRHNAGAWFVEDLCKQYNSALRQQRDFHGDAGSITVDGAVCRLLIPSTFMNLSGLAVASCAQFYKLSPEQILIAHDEIDLPPGAIKLKYAGGHGGHNGLRDIFEKLGSQNFYRLRIGVGKTDKSSKQADYVLSPPTKNEQIVIDEAMARALNQFPNMITGAMDAVMQALHTVSPSPKLENNHGI